MGVGDCEMAGEVWLSLFTFDPDAFPAGGVGSGDGWGDDAAATLPPLTIHPFTN